MRGICTLSKMVGDAVNHFRRRPPAKFVESKRMKTRFQTSIANGGAESAQAGCCSPNTASASGPAAATASSATAASTTTGTSPARTYGVRSGTSSSR